MILIGSVLFAALPLFLPGFIPTHDGEYHLIRFYEFEKMLRTGHWFPRWAAGLNSGYGIPLFNFFYPFPNYLGALFHGLGWSLADSFKLTMATGYAAAIYFCYLWLEKIFAKRAAVVGSIVFAFVPYWFVDLYVRGSVGEVLAIAWLMIALASTERQWQLRSSISIAGIIVSHNILSMVFIPLVAGYGMVRKRSVIGAMVVGIALSLYFWLPALLERQYVIGLNVVNFREHFPELSQLLIPSWGTGFSAAGIPNGEMSQQLGAMTLMVTIAAGILFSRERDRRIRWFIGANLALFALLILFMLSFSQPLWEAITPLQLLQYPWRLLSIAVPLSGIFGAYVVSRLKGSIWGWMIAVAAIAFAFGYVRPVTYAPRDDAYYLSRREFTDGTSSLGNSFSTKWLAWKRERASEDIRVIGGIGEVRKLENKDAIDMQFTISTDRNVALGVNRSYYPGWTALVDEEEAAIAPAQDGTISIMIPAGTHDVRVYFGETLLRKTANSISLAGLFWIVLSAILGVTHAYRHRHNAT